MSTYRDRTIFDPANICIYCGATEPDTKLTTEHIIPLSLGGTMVLPKASCLKCADETKRIEGYAGRHVFQDVRIIHGFPTRRPKERPSHLPLRDSFSPSPKLAPIRLVPAKEHPGMLILVNPEPAGILLRRQPDEGAKWDPWVRQITGRERVDPLLKKGISAKIYREIQPDLLLRLFAKIALGVTFASFGGVSLFAFNNMLSGIVLRRDTNPFYLVGGTTAEMDEFPTPPNKIIAHRAVVYNKTVNNISYLAIQLQLFAYLGTPIYTVIAGPLTEIGMKKLSMA